MRDTITTFFKTGLFLTLLLVITGDLIAQPAGYKYRKRVRLESDEVYGSTNHIDFPLLISVTDTDMKSVANGGGVASNSGFDIIVTALNGTPLDHQLHEYDPTTGAVILWARLAALSPTTDIEGYIYFGNSSIYTDQSTTDVWSSDFVGVWHLDNLKDATGNNSDLININTSTNTSGVVGSAREFDGDGDNLQDADGDTYLDGLSTMTVSVWAKADGTGSDRGLIHGRDPNANDNRLQIRYDAAGQSGGGTNVFRLNSRIDNAGTKTNQVLESSSTKQSTSWRYITATWSSTNTWTLYLDGLADTPTFTNARTGVTFGNTKLIIGRGAKDGLTSSWDGLIDEVWVENVERSADWIRTVHNNMNDPSSFFFIQNVNDLPVLGDIEGVDLNYETLSGPQVVSPAISVQDFNDVYVDSAGVQIFTNYQSSEDTLLFTTQNGISATWREGTSILSLSGHALQTHYQTALRSVTYENSSGSPTTSTRTIRFALYDAVGISNIVTRDLVFDQPNSAPVLVNLEASTFSYPDSYGDTTLTAAITTSDADDAYLDTLQVSFTANFVSGEDILGFTNTASLTGSWNGVSGVLTVSGSASVADYQTALRNVTYRNVNPDPTTSTRTIQFRVNDGDDWSSTGVTRDLTVTPLNNAPELDGVETAAIVYNAGDGVVTTTDSIIVSDGDDTNLDSARVKITSNYFSTEDELDFTNQLGITGTWYSGIGEILLQGSASLASYQTALRSVTYENTATQPKSPTRVIEISVSDGDIYSSALTRSISSGAPGTISDLELWLRADAGAYRDAGVNLCTDGQGVDQWHDQSGYSHNFIDNTTKPIWRESVTSLNNVPAIEFAGTGDHFRDGDGENYINGSSEFTLFSVIKSDVVNSDRGWFSARNPPNAADRDITLRYDDTGDNSGENDVIKSGILLGGTGNEIESVADIQSTDPQVVSLHWKSGFIYEMWVDGVLMNPSAQQFIPVGTIATATRINIGQGLVSSTESWDGHIAEIIFYSKSVSEGERLKVEDYLSEKYGISVGLIDPADGGDSLSVDDISGTFTALTGPRITEDVLGELTDNGTITLTLPAGFEWDTGGTAPSLTVEAAYGASTALTASYTSRTSTTVTYTIDSPSASPSKPGSITFSGLKIRPTSSTIPTSGMITNTGTTGPASSVDLGTLGIIAGSADSLTFSVAPASGNATEVLSPDIEVQLTDQYGNPRDSSGVSVTLSLTTGTGTLSGTASQSTDVNGIATFNDLSINLTGTKRFTASATGLTSTESGDFTISPSGEYTTFKIERSSGGDILDQTAGSAFTIKISAVDATESVDTDFTGTVDMTTSSSFLTGGGTSSAFTAGVLSSLTINLSDAGDHALTATTTGSSQTGTSNTFSVDAGSASVATTQITASPTAIANNGISTSTITVIVTDAYSNVLTAGGETVNMVTDAGTLLSSPSDNLDGTYTQSLQSSNTAETATISGLLNAINIQDSAQVQFNDYSTVWQSSPGDADSTAEWELVSNWSNGVPDNTDDVLVPSTPANGTRQPIITTDNQQVNDITIVSGADVTLSGSLSFDILGDLLGEGEINGGNSDSLIIGGDVLVSNIDLGYVNLSGTTQQEISPENSFQTLELDNSAGAISSGSITASTDLILTDGTLEIPPGSYLIANTQSVTSGNVKLSREISGDTGWRLLGAPLESNYGDFLDSIFTQGYTGSDSATGSPSVLWYDETYVGTDNQRWRKPSNITNSTVPGRGLFVYVFGDISGETAYSKELPVVLDITGDEDLGTASVFDFGVSYTALADTGWNLVANPFAATIDWDASGWTKTNMDNTIYVWDASLNSGNGGYLTWNGVTGSLSDGLIPPFQAFWVKANASSPELKLNVSNKTSGGVFYKINDLPAQVIFHAEMDTLEALTHIQFSPQASTKKDAYDAYQLEAPTATRLDLFSGTSEQKELSINAQPLYFGIPLQIPLDVQGWVDGLSQEGTVSFRWPQMLNVPEGWKLTLEDKVTGDQVNLLSESEYTFELESSGLAKRAPLPPYHRGFLPNQLTKYSAPSDMRFVLHVDPGTAFPNLPRKYALANNFPNPFNPSTQINFELPIESTVELTVFDVLGRKVDQPLSNVNYPAGKHSIRWSGDGYASGIYLYRLQVGGNIFTQKMVLLR